MEHAAVEGALHSETAGVKDLQRAIILTQHIRLEGVDALHPGNGGKMFEEERANASALMRIGNGKRHFGAPAGLTVLVAPKIAPHANDVFLTSLPQRSDECHVPREVELGKVAQFFICQPLFGLEKAKIDRTAAQALEECQQALLVVVLDGPDVNVAAITQQFVGSVVVWRCLIDL